MRLGSVYFRDFEVPSKITFGGRQNIAVHRLIGGRKVIDLLGQESSDIGLAGIFSGIDAAERAQTIDFLRVSGAVSPLSYGSLYFRVIVTRFAATYENRAWIPFRLSCSVIEDDTLSLDPNNVAADDVIMASALASTISTLGGVSGPDLSPGVVGATSNAGRSSVPAAPEAAGVMRAEASVDLGLQSAEFILLSTNSSAASTAQEAIAALGALEDATQCMSRFVLARALLSFRKT